MGRAALLGSVVLQHVGDSGHVESAYAVHVL